MTLEMWFFFFPQHWQKYNKVKSKGEKPTNLYSIRFLQNEEKWRNRCLWTSLFDSWGLLKIFLHKQGIL